MIRSVLIVCVLLGQVSAQSVLQRLAAPVFYEIGIEPGFESNPLNLSQPEIEKAGVDEDYLGGVRYSSSNVISFYGRLNYDPKLFQDRRTRFSLIGIHHRYQDIPERSYESLTLSIRQPLGKYRYLNLGYGLLPDLYLRNYLIRDPATLISQREACSFGSERFWLGFEHRVTRENRLEYRLTRRTEIYQAPFAAYDMAMLEAELTLKSSQLNTLPFEIAIQYGLSDNHNDIDTKDRSYGYLNIRPSLSLRLPGKHSISVDGRYDQRIYNSEANEDPLHAGRYQDEFWLEVKFAPNLPGGAVLEPFAGYRERRVESSDPDIAELKSFTRYWFGVRLGFKSVIDMYY